MNKDKPVEPFVYVPCKILPGKIAVAIKDLTEKDLRLIEQQKGNK